jgi:NO-binding membrane sensor protein with MHYT domain
MTATRLISLPLHGAVEFLTGMLALIAPFALGFTPPGAIVSILVGVCVVGLAFDAAQEPGRVSAHLAADYGLAFGAVLAALPLALAGDAGAALFLGALGLAQLGLNGLTRYSTRT